MVLMLSGRMNITMSQHEPTIVKFLHHDDTAALEWEKQLEVGKTLDEHLSVLPPDQVHHRTVTGYAQSECVIALLSAEDIATVASRRPQVRRHVNMQRRQAEKFLTRRKCKTLFGKIDSAFVAVWGKLTRMRYCVARRQVSVALSLILSPVRRGWLG